MNNLKIILYFINSKKIEYLSHSIQIHMNNILQY